MEESTYTYSICERSPDEKWYVMFEDNGSVAYMYLGKVDRGELGSIHDDLWIYNMIHLPIEECKGVFLFWAQDSTKAALIVDEECWGMYDLKKWRKLNAPRIENRITTIPKEIWDSGLSDKDGVPIKNLY